MHVPMSILKRAVALRLAFFSSPVALDLPLSEAAVAAQAEAVAAQDAARAGKADAPAPNLAVPPGDAVAGVDGDGGSGTADADKGPPAGEGNTNTEAGPDVGTGAAKVADKASVVPDGPKTSGSQVGQSVAAGEGGAGMLLEGHVTVGGVMQFQMLAIPVAPKKVGA